ncbi:Small conductance mechanosensitive ion channel, partial [Globisporangium splendens]
MSTVLYFAIFPALRYKQQHGEDECNEHAAGAGSAARCAWAAACARGDADADADVGCVQRQLHPGLLCLGMVEEDERDQALGCRRARVLRHVPAARARALVHLRAHQAALHPASRGGLSGILHGLDGVSDLGVARAHRDEGLRPGAVLLRPAELHMGRLLPRMALLALQRRRKYPASYGAADHRADHLLLGARQQHNAEVLGAGRDRSRDRSRLCPIGTLCVYSRLKQFHNVVGGLFLAFNSQFKIDDFIEVGDAKGFVHRVSLRYTTVVSMDGTKLYVPNSFFLYKPMVNFTQRPKQDIDIHVRVTTATSVEKLRLCITKLEMMLQSLHVALTSHEENQSDLRHGDKWERFFFVAMEELYHIRVYSYTDELDSRKYAMIKSEVWLAVMEIMEELGIEVLSDPHEMAKNPYAESPHARSDPTAKPPFTVEINAVIGAQDGAGGVRTQL